MINAINYNFKVFPIMLHFIKYFLMKLPVQKHHKEKQLNFADGY